MINLQNVADPADAIQMGTHNTCLYKEVDKTYTGCNVKTMGLLDSALIVVCAVIRSKTLVFIYPEIKTFFIIFLNGLFELRFYGKVNPLGLCRSINLISLFLGRVSLLIS